MACTTGVSNVAIGRNALKASTTRNLQVAIGEGALQSLVAGGYSNVAVGGYALQNCTDGYQNAAFGEHAGRYVTTGDYNTFVGRYSGGGLTTGNNCIGIGPYTLWGTVTGNDNVGIGYEACHLNTSGEKNIAVGGKSLRSVTSGTKNTCVGYDAGHNISTGGYNVCIGHRAGQNQVDTASERLYIAHELGGPGNANLWVYGDSSGACTQGNNSSSWTTTSDQRLKKNIVDNNVGLTAIDQLQVRNFEYRTEGEIDRSQFTDKVSTAKFSKEEAEAGEGVEGEYKQKIALGHTGTQIGIIAQELEAVLPDCVSTDERGIKTVDTDEVMWHMLTAIKELSTKNTALAARVATLEAS